MLTVIDEDVEIDTKHLTQLKSHKIDQFLFHFQIKKCSEVDCFYCILNPPRPPVDVFDAIQFVPDPTLDENGAYKSFEDLYGTATDDSGRPSLTHKPQLTDRD
ncbi:hypothetical protein MAR_017334 [Mya arenaria]|uniref:Uncharacterized protein n=1 Tax=Mya arenaria TaxID=6604 RepID=A0ABY7EJJ7_MYAAR|nr:hypothetical protein MAR_017334 [Mya arenaria]